MTKLALYRDNNIIYSVQYVLWDWAGTIVSYGSPNPIALKWIYTFNKHNISQYIISNEASLDKLYDSISALDLEEIFSAKVICVGNGYVPKPDKSMYEAFLSSVNFEIDNREVLFIGDSESDHLFAQNVLCNFIYISDINKYAIKIKVP